MEASPSKKEQAFERKCRRERCGKGQVEKWDG